MGYLRGLSTYLNQNYRRDLFTEFKENNSFLEFHLAGHKKKLAYIAANKRYDLVLKEVSSKLITIPKVHVKFFYPSELAEKVNPLIKIDEQVRGRNLQPIFNPTRRFHIKNKNLYPLMILKTPISITLLEGEVLEGLITEFTMYEIFLELSPGVEIVVLRHAIFNALDKETNRSLLKKFQDTAKDWKKTPLWVEDGTEE